MANGGICGFGEVAAVGQRRQLEIRASEAFFGGYGGGNDLDTNVLATSNTWTLITFTYDGTTLRSYVNGTAGGTLSWSSSATDTKFGIGYSGSGVGYGNGLIDEVGIWSRALTQAEINYLWNSGAGARPFNASAPVSANWTLSSYDAYTGQVLLNNFASIYLSNGSVIDVSTTNGSLVTPILSNSTATVTMVEFISSENSANSPISFVGYMRNYTGAVNFTELLNISMAQSNITFSATERITGATVVGANFTTINLTNVTHYMRANTNYTVNATAASYLTKGIVYNSTPFLTQNVTITDMYNLLGNVTLKNIFNNASISMFNVTISNGQYSYSELCTTTNGTCSFQLIRSLLYNVTVESNGTVTQSYTDVNMSTNLSASSYKAIAYVTLYDRLSNVSLLPFTVLNPPQSNTTVNGSLTIIMDIATNNLTFISPGYDSRSVAYVINASGTYYLNYSMSRNLTVNIINESSGDLFLINSTDELVLTMVCPDVEVQYIITQQNQSIETCAWSYIRLDAYYPSSSLFRTIIPAYTTPNITFVMPDPNTVTVYQIIIQLNDLTGSFLSGIGYLYKLIGETTYEIIGQRFDAQSTINTYLIKDSLYLFALRSDTGEQRVVGYFGADQAGQKTITVPTITFSPSTIVLGGEIIWAWSESNPSLIRFAFNDSTGADSTLTFYIFNGTNVSDVLMNVTNTNVTSIIYTYIGDTDANYVACFTAATSVGNYQECKSYAGTTPIDNITDGTYFTAVEKRQMATGISTVGLLIILFGVGMFSPAAALITVALVAEVLALSGLFLIRESVFITQGVIALLALLGTFAFFYEVNKKK